MNSSSVPGLKILPESLSSSATGWWFVYNGKNYMNYFMMKVGDNYDEFVSRVVIPHAEKVYKEVVECQEKG